MQPLAAIFASRLFQLISDLTFLFRSMSLATVVYTFRDKPVSRLIDSVNSIRRFPSGNKTQIVVVDYGSKEIYRSALEISCKDHDIKVIRSETQGLPWSRGIAMNIGILAVETDIFISTDIDMIYEFDIVAEVCENLQKRSKLHCDTYWLPPSGNRRKAVVHGAGHHYGGCMAMYVDDFKFIGCFNEQIEFWGAEDIELEFKSLRAGLSTNWLSSNNRMYHVWHKVSHGFGDIRPLLSICNDNLACIRALVPLSEPDVKKAQGCGKILTADDRPLVQLIQTKNLKNFKVFSGEFNEKLLTEIIKCLAAGDVAFIKTGPRTFYEKYSHHPLTIILFKFFSRIDCLLGRVRF